MENNENYGITNIANHLSNQTKNVVLFGLSGSGKDTIANDLELNYDYFKIRIAGTIKQIIQEKHLFSEEELEEAKRIQAKLRQEHHDVGNYLGIATTNRVKLIISGKVSEFKYKQSYQPIVVHDGRGLDNEILLFLQENDWVCIYLSRTNYDKEFRNANHWTEQGSIEKSLEFIEKNNFYDKSIIIINDKEQTELDEKNIKIAEKCLGYFNISEDSSPNNLLGVVKYCIENELI